MTVGVAVNIVIPILDDDPETDVASGVVTGLPAELSASFNPATDEVTITGTVTDLALVDTTVTVQVDADDDGSPALSAQPMLFDLIFEDIAVSPFVGQFVVSEILYTESEKYDPAAPFDALIMDEFIEFTNLGPAINIENWYVSDTSVRCNAVVIHEGAVHKAVSLGATERRMMSVR